MRLITLFLIFFAMNLEAKSLLDEIGVSKCKEQVEARLKSWGYFDNWRKRLDQDTNFFYWSPTKDIGTWIKIKKEKFILQISKVNSSISINNFFNLNNCSQRVSYEKGIKVKKGDFSDSNLLKLAKEKKNMVFYMWSPHMPYSVRGLKELFEYSKKSKEFEFIFLLDPNANTKFAKKILKKNKLPVIFATKFYSLELKVRNALLHYPGVIFMKNGTFVSDVIPGLKSTNEYIKLARRFIKNDI